jgi:hypothetical protein
MRTILNYTIWAETPTLTFAVPGKGRTGKGACGPKIRSLGTFIS